MTLQAVFFGAIGTLAETSELQRRAYNMAFAAADLDWVWDRESYARMLREPGGKTRIRTYAEQAGDRVDAAAVHAAKQMYFAMLLAREGVDLRPGVGDLINALQARGLLLALVTGTDAAQVDALLAALPISRDDFDWVGDRTRAARGKPAPDLYHAAMDDLGLLPHHVLVIEDTPESAQAAVDAGLATIGFAGEAARGRAFPAGVEIVDRLDRDHLNRNSRAGVIAAE
tara:strand:- start:1341 stop:2024 length:684 start_codon:yes stop_codon:yes gene_type:complete